MSQTLRRRTGARMPRPRTRAGRGLSSPQRGGSVWLLSPHTTVREGHAAGGGRDKGTDNAGPNSTQLGGGEGTQGPRGARFPSTFPMPVFQFPKEFSSGNVEIYADLLPLLQIKRILRKILTFFHGREEGSFQVMQKPGRISSLLIPRLFLSPPPFQQPPLLPPISTQNNRLGSRAGHPVKRLIRPPPPTAAEMNAFFHP